MGKLQQAAMMYIVSQKMEDLDIEELRKVFIGLDKDGNGLLSKEELISGMSILYDSKERAQAEVNSLLLKLPISAKGSILYSGKNIVKLKNKSFCWLQQIRPKLQLRNM